MTEEKILAQRWEKKKANLETLANSIQRLRLNISNDLKSENEKEFLTALVIAVMDKTGERVGNENSAGNGHHGVTGFKKKHIQVNGNTVSLNYMGKSGVDHEKCFTDEKLAAALSKAIQNSPNENVFVTSSGFQVSADKINRYLKAFGVSAKDLRGFNANKWIIEKLKSLDIGPEEKERKTQFNKIVKAVAKKIGHGAATLKKHYMIPELPEHFIGTGEIVELKELGYYVNGGVMEKKEMGDSEMLKKWKSVNNMTKSDLKKFYSSKEGKELDKQTYNKWKSLVNMSKGELEKFYNSQEGKEAGLTPGEAKEKGIDSGRESARWIIKMKDTPVSEWTPAMWKWAKKQISFISRMRGNKGGLYDDKGNKTRKHTSLLIWGHNPEKYANGGSFEPGGPVTSSVVGKRLLAPNDFIGTWSELQKQNPDLWNTGILRRSLNPRGAKEVIPEDIHTKQGQWQNYGQYNEIEAETIYGKPDRYGYYLDKDGNSINDIETGDLVKDEWDYDNNAERIKATISNEQLKNNLIESFDTKEGKDYLSKVVAALPKNPDGSITAYRIGAVGEGIKSYTVSEGMAKTFSNQGTDIMPAGLPSLPKEGYKDFGVLPANIVKINPEGIVAWSPYDSEILVQSKYVKTFDATNPDIRFNQGGPVTSSVVGKHKHEFKQGGPIPSMSIPAEEIEEFAYEGRGIFDFIKAKAFVKKYFGETIIKSIGDGSAGKAYLTEDNITLKITRSSSEAKVAHILLGDKNKYHAEIYNVIQLGDADIYLIWREFIPVALINEETAYLWETMQDIETTARQNQRTFDYELERPEWQLREDEKTIIKSYYARYKSLKDWFKEKNIKPNDLNKYNMAIKDGEIICFDCQYKQGGTFDNSEKNSNFVPNIINHVISGKSKVRNGEAIQAAASYLKRSKGAGAATKGSKFFKQEEAERLKAYITDCDTWIPISEFKNYISEGAEQKVYLIDGKNVIKLNDTIFYNSWEDYFHSLLLHNYFFPDTAYELIGFTEQNHILYAVVKQPFVLETAKTDLEAVKKFMADNGFTNTKNNDYYNPQLNLILEDLHDENVLTKDSLLYFIDTVFYVKEKFAQGGPVTSSVVEKQFNKPQPMKGKINLKKWNRLNAHIAEKVEMLPLPAIDNYKEFDRRANPIRGENYIDDLKAKIEKEGIISPLALSYGVEDFRLSLGEGNHRLAIAKELGYTHLPAYVKLYRKNSKGKKAEPSRKFAYDSIYDDNGKLLRGKEFEVKPSEIVGLNDKMAKGGVVNKGISASVSAAIDDIIKAGNINLTAMPAGFLYKLVKDHLADMGIEEITLDNDVEFYEDYKIYPTDFEKAMLKTLYDKEYIYAFTNKYYQTPEFDEISLFPAAYDFYVQVNERVKTRTGVKYGYDLFPNEAGLGTGLKTSSDVEYVPARPQKKGQKLTSQKLTAETQKFIREAQDVADYIALVETAAEKKKFVQELNDVIEFIGMSDEKKAQELKGKYAKILTTKETQIALEDYKNKIFIDNNKSRHEYRFFRVVDALFNQVNYKWLKDNLRAKMGQKTDIMSINDFKKGLNSGRFIEYKFEEGGLLTTKTDLQNLSKEQLKFLIAQLELGMTDLIKTGDTEKVKKANLLIGKCIDLYNQAPVAGPGIKFEEGGSLDLSSYQKRVAENMKYMGTDYKEWKSIPVLLFQNTPNAKGEEVSMPVFDFPKGYEHAKSLFPSSQTGDMNCELCGKIPIRTVYWIQNDLKKLTLAVGSECVKHVGDGTSGKENVRKAKIELAKMLDNDLSKLASLIAKLYRRKKDIGYGRSQVEWNRTYVGVADEWTTGKLLEQLTAIHAIGTDLLMEKKKYPSDIRDSIMWGYVYKALPTFGWQNELDLVKRNYESHETAEKNILSWFTRNEKQATGMLAQAAGVLKVIHPEIDYVSDYLKAQELPADEEEMERGGKMNDDADTQKWISCPRCNGSGELEHYRHIQAGKCFECGGKGVVPNTEVAAIKERMLLTKQKYEEKRKVANEKAKALEERVWSRRAEFARDFNNKIIEKVILPNTSTDVLLKRENFQTAIELAKRINISNGSDFIEALKDYGFKLYLSNYFYYPLEKFLREKYNYFEYLKNVLPLDDFFLFSTSDYLSKQNKSQNKTIDLLIAKYRPEYEKIGRYDDDIIEDRPTGKMELGGTVVDVLPLPAGTEVVNGFYSPIEKSLRETKAETLSANKWLSMLGKGDEMIYTGLRDFLMSKRPDEQVKKIALLDFIKNNRIQIVEVVKGSVFDFTEDDIADLKINYHGAGSWVVKTKEGSTVEFPLAKADDKAEATAYALELLNYDNASKRESKPKFEKYQLEGDKSNYKEVLITMPGKVEKKLPKGYSFIDDGNKVGVVPDEQIHARPLNGQWFNTESDALNAALDHLNINSKTEFRSSHFNEHNILAHLRMNIRTDAEGKKTLFIEELQSDWGQKGKKEGFVTANTDEQIQAKFKEQGYTTQKDGEHYTVVFNAQGQRVGDVRNERLNKTKRYLVEKHEKATIPSAPFVTDTNAWVKLALKTALQHAIKEGAEQIAWTTGEQQNDRYDLSKQVDKIEITQREVKGEKIDSYRAKVYKDGKILEDKDYIAFKDFEGMFGKEIAKKIENGETNFEGEALRVGGKGMIGFYGSPQEEKLGIVGQVAESLFGKGSVKTTDIETKKDIGGKTEVLNRNGEVVNKYGGGDNEINNAKMEAEKIGGSIRRNIDRNTTQHSITITPKIKAEAERGLPQFQAGGTINIGDYTNAGRVDDKTETQFLVDGKWFHKSLIKKIEPNENVKIASIIAKLKKERGEGQITLYHGTDNKSYDNILKTGMIGVGAGITFFTNSRSEAKQYAKNKSRYRNIDEDGKVIEITMPRYAVQKNRATGEYETEFSLKEKNGLYVPTNESLLSEENR